MCAAKNKRRKVIGSDGSRHKVGQFDVTYEIGSLDYQNRKRRIAEGTPVVEPKPEPTYPAYVKSELGMRHAALHDASLEKHLPESPKSFRLKKRLEQDSVAKRKVAVARISPVAKFDKQKQDHDKLFRDSLSPRADVWCYVKRSDSAFALKIPFRTIDAAKGHAGRESRLEHVVYCEVYCDDRLLLVYVKGQKQYTVPSGESNSAIRRPREKSLTKEQESDFESRRGCSHGHLAFND